MSGSSIKQPLSSPNPERMEDAGPIQAGLALHCVRPYFVQLGLSVAPARGSSIRMGAAAVDEHGGPELGR